LENIGTKLDFDSLQYAVSQKVHHLLEAMDLGFLEVFLNSDRDE